MYARPQELHLSLRDYESFLLIIYPLLSSINKLEIMGERSGN